MPEMNYPETLAYLNARLPMFSRIGKAAYKADLSNTHALMDLLGHPERGLKCVHIAGTNGKGSTSNMIASVLQEAGYRTGLHTSPHLRDFRERFRTNGEMIPKEAVADFVEQHHDAFEPIGASFFEWGVALVLDWFHREKTDIAVIECGLGGRLDSTNVVTPEVCVITNIGWDHADLLGDTLEKIAGEKAGIIKPGIPVVIGEAQGTIAEVFRRRAEEVAAPIYFTDQAALMPYALDLAGRPQVPVAAGADTSGGYYPYELGLPPEERYWPAPVALRPNPPEQALDLLEQSIDQGALLIGIGPTTNLALLERRRPGILARANLVLMGGYVFPVRPGYPHWGNDMDFNFQVDVRSAQFVLEHSNPLLVPLSVTVETALRRADLPALSAAGPLARLIARQAEQFAVDEQNETRIGAVCAGLPDDLINFQHDPLACAVALGWREGIEIEEVRISIEEKDGLLYERPDPAGRPFRVVTRVDGERFDRFWLEQVTRL